MNSACAIPNCRKKAPDYEAFCASHRDTPKMIVEMKPYLVIADLDPPSKPFAVLSIDPTQREGNGCKAIVVSLHSTRAEAAAAIQEAYHGGLP